MADFTTPPGSLFLASAHCFQEQHPPVNIDPLAPFLLAKDEVQARPTASPPSYLLPTFFGRKITSIATIFENSLWLADDLHQPSWHPQLQVWSEKESILLVETVKCLGGCSSSEDFDWGEVAAYFHTKKTKDECRTWYIHLIEWSTMLEKETDAFPPIPDAESVAQAATDALLAPEVTSVDRPKKTMSRRGTSADTAVDNGADSRPRRRRRALDIERDYKCPVPECMRAYGTEGALRYHMRLKHPDEKVQIVKRERLVSDEEASDDSVPIPASLPAPSLTSGMASDADGIPTPAAHLPSLMSTPPPDPSSTTPPPLLPPGYGIVGLGAMGLGGIAFQPQGPSPSPLPSFNTSLSLGGSIWDKASLLLSQGANPNQTQPQPNSQR